MSSGRVVGSVGEETLAGTLYLTARGRQYFLLLDPRVALEALVASGEIHGEELFLLNELCRELKRQEFVPPKSKQPESTEAVRWE